MKDRDVRRRLQDESARLVPDNFREIAERAGIPQEANKAPIAAEKPKRRKTRVWAWGSVAAAAVLCLSVVLPLTLPGSPSGPPVTAVSNSVITIDINPSVELVADPNDVITEVRALNKAAALLLNGRKAELVGKSAAEAGALIAGYARALDYLSPGRDVKVSAVNDNAEHEQTVTREVAQAVAQAAPEGTVVTPEDDEALARQAAEYGVSVGKMRLVLEAVRLTGMDKEDAAELSVQKLNEIVRAYDAAATGKFEEDLNRELQKLERERDAALREMEALKRDAEKLAEDAEEAEDAPEKLPALNAAYQKLLEKLPQETPFGEITEDNLDLFAEYAEQLAERLDEERERLEEEYEDKEEAFEKSVKQKLDEDEDFDFDDEEDDD